jgi:hypothetical protein
MKYTMWEPQFGQCGSCHSFFTNIRLVSKNGECYFTCYPCWFESVDKNMTIELEIVVGVRQNWDVNTTFTIESPRIKGSKVYNQ